MADETSVPVSENLNTKNGNFICGVVEGKSNKWKITLSNIHEIKFPMVNIVN